MLYSRAPGPGPGVKDTLLSDGLRAVFAAGGREWDLGKALNARRNRDCGGRSETHTDQQSGDGNNHQKVDDRRDDQEVDNGVEELADVDLTRLDVVGRQRMRGCNRMKYRQVNDEAGEVRRASQRGDKGSDDVRGE